MITREQFQLQVDRLCDTFGDKHFPDQRTHMIWDDVRAYEYPTIIAVVDSFIRNSKFAPLPGDFSEALKGAGAQKQRYSLGEVQPREIAQCRDCADSGFIRLKRIDTHEDWARWHAGSAPCHCHRGRMVIEAGQRKPKHPIDFGPQFSESWLKSYSIVPAWPQGAA